MTYIFITYEAVELFASDRFLQSSENEVSEALCRILTLESLDWFHNRIHLQKCEKGLVFFTSDSSYRKGLLFDLTTFKGFTKDTDSRSIINIFQKTIKYAIRYFEKLPLASCDRNLPDQPIAIIFPNPFVAATHVPKIVIDRNSSKFQKKGLDYLTVYDYSTDSKISVSFTSLNKAYEEVRNLNFKELSKQKSEIRSNIRGFSITTLEHQNTTIDSNIGFDNWINYYLTDVQKNFVCSDTSGPERLEGAAGTGKTLCLILRCIYLLKKSVEENKEFHIIFFTHSLSTKERIERVFRSNWELFDLCDEKPENSHPRQSIKVTTLQEWSAEHLGTNSISDNEFLDKDALESKIRQILYIEQAYSSIKKELWQQTFDLFCSQKFKDFINYTPDETILEMLRQEIAVLIKGRASSDFDKYKSIARPKYSMPLEEDADFRFVFMVYKKYQNALEKVGQYDSDDIILTALGQVDTPIWNRRRIRDGYDVCVIDETHLFNINELSIFHFVNKPLDGSDNINANPKIIFAIDKAQATGDWGVDDVSILTALKLKEDSNNEHFNTVFRCSPDIVNLAYNILTSGTTMFTNFENPLLYTSFNLVKEDELKSVPPEYTMVKDDEDAIKCGVEWAEKYCSEHKSTKNQVLLIGVNEILVSQLKDYLQSRNKPFVILQSRSDEQAIRKAKEGNKFVISQIDYVGGLEFEAVVIIGVDDGRVPPSKLSKNEAYHVISYAWHSRMYVAVTRARYAIKMIGDVSRGASPLLYSSILTDSVKYTGPSIIDI